MIDRSTLVFAAVGTLAVGFLMTVRQWPGMQVPAVLGAATTLWFYGNKAWAERSTDVASIARHIMVATLVLSVPLRAFGSSLGLGALLLAVLAFFVWLAAIMR
jgi:hypothetical protein